jgi:hypothetical protein
LIEGIKKNLCQTDIDENTPSNPKYKKTVKLMYLKLKEFMDYLVYFDNLKIKLKRKIV